MKRIIIIFFIIVFNSDLLYCQSKEESFSISGQLRLLVFFETVTPQEQTLVVINNTTKGALTDSLGNFKIDSLRAGRYILNIRGFGYQPLDTVVTITNKSIENLNLSIIADCEINADVARSDIKKNNIRLLVFGGIAPVVYGTDAVFEAKYGLQYYDYGCVVPAYECAVQYNNVIFQYLDSKYGKVWRKEIRKDVVGFKKHK